MGPFITIAFWIVILSSCLQANPIPKSNPDDWDIDFLRDTDLVNCTSDSTFYTPTNVADHCLTSALDCILRELNGTARDECDDKHNYIHSQAEIMSVVIKQRQGYIYPLNNSTECACEGWPLTSFQEFLNGMESALQQHNSNSSNLN